ncbi:MAG: hypothetical protein LC808_27585, partial [Actinobacteria bacterium]|nr:hypothetical protein [Actinomycetota bacterium]
LSGTSDPHRMAPPRARLDLTVVNLRCRVSGLRDQRVMPITPPDLRRRIREWVDDLWDLDDDTPETETWDRRALALHGEVVRALGPRFEVAYDE